MFCLVRTEASARRQDGISFLLIDMKTPGIRISPIISIDGEHSLNEVFFDNVRVPVANLHRRAGQGLDLRQVAAGARAHRHRRCRRFQAPRPAHCANWRGARRSAGKPLLDDPLFQARLADIEIELMALETMELRALCEAAKGKGPGAESSLLKIKGTEVQQAIQQLMMDMAGAVRRGAARATQPRPRLRRRGAAQLHVRPRRHHLRRLERGAEEHHGQGRARAVTRGRA